MSQRTWELVFFVIFVACLAVVILLLVDAGDRSSSHRFSGPSCYIASGTMGAGAPNGTQGAPIGRDSFRLESLQQGATLIGLELAAMFKREVL